MSSTPPSAGTVEFPIVLPLFVVASCIQGWLLSITQPARESRHLPLNLSGNVFPIIEGHRDRLSIRLATLVVKNHLGVRLTNHHNQMLFAFRKIKRAQMNQGM